MSLCGLFSAVLWNPNAKTAHGVTAADAVERRQRLASEEEGEGAGDESNSRVTSKEIARRASISRLDELHVSARRNSLGLVDADALQAMTQGRRGSSGRRGSGASSPQSQQKGATSTATKHQHSSGEPTHDYLSNLDEKQFSELLLPTFAFAYTWSIGATMADPLLRQNFGHFSETLFEAVKFPRGGSIYSGFLDYRNGPEFRPWEDLAPSFSFLPGANPLASFFTVLVPTQDTTRHSFLVDKLISARCSPFLTGSSGVGKSVVLSRLLQTLKENEDIQPVTLIFSAQTSSEQTQTSIEAKLEKKRKTLLAPPAGKELMWSG